MTERMNRCLPPFCPSLPYQVGDSPSYRKGPSIFSPTMFIQGESPASPTTFHFLPPVSPLSTSSFFSQPSKKKRKGRLPLLSLFFHLPFLRRERRFLLLPPPPPPPPRSGKVNNGGRGGGKKIGDDSRDRARQGGRSTASF